LTLCHTFKMVAMSHFTSQRTLPGDGGYSLLAAYIGGPVA